MRGALGCPFKATFSPVPQMWMSVRITWPVLGRSV